MHPSSVLIFLISVVQVNGSFLSSVGPQNITWAICPLLADGTNLLECATLQVPINYDCPDQGSIELGVARHLARDQHKRIGNLFYNPGGPGDGVTTAVGAAIAYNLFKPDILDSFDIIAVDLRGTGRSSPINCSSDLYQNLSTVSYLSDRAAFDEARKTNMRFRQSCFDLSNSSLVDYMDTISIAKDHEYVRRAIGNELSTWLGQSYGTQLAAQYAELFPDALRAVLLDGNDDVSQSPVALLEKSAASQEAALKFFFQWCYKQNSTVCPAAHSNQSLENTWSALLDKAASKGGQRSQNLVRSATYHSLYTPSTQWPRLAQGIYDTVFRNNDSFFTAPVASKQGVYNASMDYATVAISCGDRPGEPSPTAMRLKELLISSQAPLMHGISTTLIFITECIGWPFPARNPPHMITIPRTNKNLKFLMVTTLYDPATSTTWTQTLQQQIGEDRAMVLVRNQGGHTTYFKPEALDGPTVAAMNKFLLTTETPPSGTEYEN